MSAVARVYDLTIRRVQLRGLGDLLQNWAIDLHSAYRPETNSPSEGTLSHRPISVSHPR